jgi:hypothetical protein
MAGQIVLQVAGIEDFKNRGNVNHFTFGQPGPAHRLDRNTVVSNKKGGPGDRASIAAAVIFGMFARFQGGFHLALGREGSHPAPCGGI